MTLSFTLSMPGRSSWNGRWSGEEKLYAIVKTFTGKKGQQKAEEILKQQYYSYGWSDGWRAGIKVEQVDPARARKIRSKSQGFCGYSWMVDSIIRHGAIYADESEMSQKQESAVPA